VIHLHRPIPMDHIRLLLWDLDGTLVDSMADLVASVNALREHRALPPLPLATIRSYVGSGARTLIQRALGENARELDQALTFFLDHYQSHLLDQTRSYPGIPELLETLQERSLRMVVLTNKPLAHSETILQGLGLDPFFVRVVGGDSFPTRKPDPAGALALLAELRVAPKEALMIGDSDNDILTAHHGGLWSLGVTYGYAPESFAHAEPDGRVDDVHDLGSILNPWK